jgi:hypothetical protein
LAIYEITKEAIVAAQPTTLAAHGLKEREDLQRLLRASIHLIDPDLMVLSEEFCEWEDSKRRIDLLGLDRDANLAVIELKRSEDGGHMELQAIRYAAMASSMTFAQAVEAHAAYLSRIVEEGDARTRILGFLGWAEPQEESFAQDVRIILVSGDFSRELTTSVMWLNDRDLDVRCVRLRPYCLDGHVLLDVQQIVPLPEAADYQIKMKEKAIQQRERSSRDTTKYDLILNGKSYSRLPKRRLIYQIVRACVEDGASPQEIAKILPGGDGRWICVEGLQDGESFREKASAQQGPYGASPDLMRFFAADGEILPFGTSSYALSNQWGPSTLTTVEQLLKKYPKVTAKYAPSATHGGDLS